MSRADPFALPFALQAEKLGDLVDSQHIGIMADRFHLHIRTSVVTTRFWTRPSISLPI